MKELRVTKTALLGSAFALFVCFSMLVGSSFSWFTDKVSSGDNLIQSGSFEVEFLWADGNVNVDGADWSDVSEGAIFPNDRWAPGVTVSKHFRIDNVGETAYDYGVRLVADGDIGNIADFIDVYCVKNGAAAEETYVGKLSELLGDKDSLNKTVSGTLTPDDEAQIWTVTFKMSEKMENPIAGSVLGCKFHVELVATQSVSVSSGSGN